MLDIIQFIYLIAVTVSCIGCPQNSKSREYILAGGPGILFTFLYLQRKPMLKLDYTRRGSTINKVNKNILVKKD